MRGEALARGVRDALGLVGLTERARDRARKLSGGLKRRLNLAVALVHSPDLLLLDEPTVGIDPQARLHILEVIRAQVKAGRAVLYTSHYLEEAISATAWRSSTMGVLASGTPKDASPGGGGPRQVQAERPASRGAPARGCRGVLLSRGGSLLGGGWRGLPRSRARELFQEGTSSGPEDPEPNLKPVPKLTGPGLRD
jgi:ABC-2 type transport system ATP-binding protein